MESATFMDINGLSDDATAQRTAPSALQHLVLSVANWYLGLLSRTPLGLRILRALQLAHPYELAFAAGQRQRAHHFHRTLKPQRPCAQPLYEALPPQQELALPVRPRPIPGRPVHRG